MQMIAILRGGCKMDVVGRWAEVHPNRSLDSAVLSPLRTSRTDDDPRVVPTSDAGYSSAAQVERASEREDSSCFSMQITRKKMTASPSMGVQPEICSSGAHGRSQPGYLVTPPEPRMRCANPSYETRLIGVLHHA